LPEGEGKIIGFLSAVAMSDSIQAADGNNTRTITMQGKSRTILLTVQRSPLKTKAMAEKGRQKSLLIDTLSFRARMLQVYSNV